MSTITPSQLTKIKTACSVLLEDLDGDVIQYSRFKASAAIRALEQTVDNRGLGDAYREKLAEAEESVRINLNLERVRKYNT